MGGLVSFLQWVWSGIGGLGGFVGLLGGGCGVFALLNGIGKKHGQVGEPSSETEKESIDAATPDVDRHAGEPDAGSSQRDDRSDEESMGELAETVRIQQEVLVETVELIEQIANRQQSLTRNLQAAIDMFDRQAAFNKQIMDTFAQQTDINKRLTELHTSR